VSVKLKDQCTVIAVYRVHDVWIEIRDQAFVLYRVEVAEQFTNFVLPGIEGCGNQILAEYPAFQIERDPAFGHRFTVGSCSGGREIPGAAKLADLAVCERHDEQGVGGEIDLAPDDACITARIGNAGDNLVLAWTERHAGNESTFAIDLCCNVV